MRKANGVEMIIDRKNDIYGFIFTPDFDTSQEMDIGRFMNRFYDGENKIVKTTYDYNGLSLPVLIVGSMASEYAKKCDEMLRVECDFAYERRNGVDKKEMGKKSFGEYFYPMVLNEKPYFVSTRNMFSVYVYSANCVFFVLNPYAYIFKGEELEINMEYVDGYMRPKNTACINAYLNDIENRRNDYLRELDSIFSMIAAKGRANGFVAGFGNMFLTTGNLLLVGTKEDSDTCLKRKLFPYEMENGEIKRYTSDELEVKENKKLAYAAKCKVVDKRLTLLEKMLREKGYTWTIISHNKVNFDENGDYSVWMNAQVGDRVHYGWFKESDFIDWLNMEGRIPFHRSKVGYFAKMLASVSNGDYVFVKCETTENIREISRLDDYEVVAVFKKHTTNRIIRMTLEEIKSVIVTYAPIKVYTLEDFEKDFKKENGFVAKIKEAVKLA